MARSPECRWVKPRAAAMLFGLLLLVQCNKQTPDPTVRAKTSEKSAALAVNQWPLETLTATNSIAFEDRATLTGNAVVTKQATGAVLAFNAELALGFDAVLTGSVKSDTLVLKDRAIITGTARYNNVTSSGTIQGGGSSPLSLPLFTIPALPTGTPGSQDVTLTSSQQQTRAAGAYRDVLLNSGNSGTPTRLTLSGGLYHFKSLTVLNDAGVQCSAACEIRVQGRVAVGDRSFLKPQSGVPGLGVGNVELLIGGANGAAGPAGWPAALEVNNDGQLRAYTLAPNGTARLGHRTVLQGKVVARDVLVGFDSDAEGLQLPLISTQPVNVTVREDQPASFSIAVSNPAGVTYRWQRDGVDVQGPAGAGATYTLAHAPVSADGAQFRVKVTNAAGTVTSNAATLHVIPCEDTDTTCNAFDDDCNGVNDDGFGPRCPSLTEPGSVVLHCVNGMVQASACTDGISCNGAEFCQDGACHDGPDLIVDDGNDCTVDSCTHPGGVRHDPLPPGTACGDSNDCNGIDQCTAAGVCEAKDLIFSTDPCLRDVCDPATGWDLAPAAPGTSCDDSDVSNDPDFCDGAGRCSPPERTQVGEGPGEIAPSVGKGPPYPEGRVAGWFKSCGFNAPPSDQDLFAHCAPAAETYSDRPISEQTVLRIELPDPVPNIGECYTAPTVAIYADDQLLQQFDAYPNCQLGACEPFELRPLVVAQFPPGQQTTTIKYTIFGGGPFPCPNTLLQLNTATVSLTGEDFPPDLCTFFERPDGGVDTFCTLLRFDAFGAGPPPPADGRLCFEWNTTFIDEGYGEDMQGEPRSVGGQRYPAAFAEYQLEIAGPAGARAIGANYADDCSGISATTQPRYLDAEGCIPLEEPFGGVQILPTALLVHRFGETPEQGGLSFRARLRTNLKDGYRIRSSNLDTSLDNDPYDVVEFDVNDFVTDWTFVNGWAVPQQRMVLAPRIAATPATNAAAALGALLATPDNSHPGDPLEVRVNEGHQYCSLEGECQTDADCPALQSCSGAKSCAGTTTTCNEDVECPGSTCDPIRICDVDQQRCAVAGQVCGNFNAGICTAQSLRCASCVEDSNFSVNMVDGAQLLQVGPANPPADPACCDQDNDCLGAQLCLPVPGKSCSTGQPSFCHWPDQSRWRSVILHEAGHHIQNAVIGVPQAVSEYSFNCGVDGCPAQRTGASSIQLADPPGISPMCGCEHITAANGLHCMQSVERFTNALNEGLAHFIAARVMNSSTETDCTFPYYKEVMDDAVNLVSSVCTGAPDGDCVAITPWDGITRNKRMPPVPIDCATPLPWRDTFCTAPLAPPEGGDAAFINLTTEHDILQFFWSVHSRGSRSPLGDILGTLATTCGGTCATSHIRWAPPTVENPGVGATRSLATGAQTYFGAGSQELAQFEQAAQDHGITPETSP